MIFYNLIMPGPILIPIDSVYLYQTVIKCLLRKRKIRMPELNLLIMHTAHNNWEWVVPCSKNTNQLPCETDS